MRDSGERRPTAPDGPRISHTDGRTAPSTPWEDAVFVSRCAVGEDEEQGESGQGVARRDHLLPPLVLQLDQASQWLEPQGSDEEEDGDRPEGQPSPACREKQRDRRHPHPVVCPRDRRGEQPGDGEGEHCRQLVPPRERGPRDHHTDRDHEQGGHHPDRGRQGRRVDHPVDDGRERLVVGREDVGTSELPEGQDPPGPVPPRPGRVDQGSDRHAREEARRAECHSRRSRRRRK